jgi:hypothetical protein
VYGFDERPQTNEWAHAINTMFGAVKRRFPGLRTMAAVRWRGVERQPNGNPGLAQVADSIDLWVQLYSLWNTTDEQYWTALGGAHEAWAYHCVSPRPDINSRTGVPGPMRWLNTWLENPAIDARLLMWWAAEVEAKGWLFWAINQWSTEAKNVPPAQTQILEPLPGHLFSDFSARMYNGRANPLDHHAFSNGDGMLIYPGKSGPLSSVRLENIRDGFEDAALLRQLPAERRHAIIAQAIQSRTGYPAPHLPSPLGINVSVGALELEALRRQVAQEVAQRVANQVSSSIGGEDLQPPAVW